MCIIAVKNKGVKMPAFSTIEECFLNNPDGAGYMVARGGKVEIHKGFMDLDSFYNEIKIIPDEVPAIFHFRIGTSGGNIPANTHPFPVVKKMKDLKSLDISCDLGVVHNGVIHNITPGPGVSDTMQYVHDRLNPIYQAFPDFLKVKAMRDIIEGDISSKMAFLTASGKIYKIGNFIEDGGIYYSNDSYKPYKPSAYWGRGLGSWYKSFEYREIMPLYTVDGVSVKNALGLKVSNPDAYGIDSKGSVYLISECYESAYLMQGYRAYLKGKRKVQFNPKEVIEFEVR